MLPMDTFDVNAGLSALMYELKNIESIEGVPLKQVIDSNMISSERYEQCREIIESNNLGDFIISDTSWQEDKDYGTMSAATFQSANGDTYVAFTGTGDGNWPYNADSAYGEGSSDMQDWALEYFEDTVKQNYNGSGSLQVTGHSQGGNNAMYVTMASEYGDLIDSCVSVDGPGFNESIIKEIKNKFGEDHYNAQREKSYGVYGQNDFVHGLGEVQTIPSDNTFFVTTEDDGFAGYHDIWTHISDGKLNNHYKDKIPEGEISKLITIVNENLMDLPKDVRKDTAVVIMKLIENKINGGERILVNIAPGEYLDLIPLIPVIWETLKNNPREVLSILNELGIMEYLAENPAVLFGVVAVALVLLPTILKIDRWIERIDMLIDIVEYLTGLDIDKHIQEVLLNCLNAAKVLVNSILEFIHSKSAGAKYVANNPYFSVNTTKLQDYASRIGDVNYRLSALSDDLNGLYGQVKFTDLWDILVSNVVTSESGTLNRVKGYLIYASDKFEEAEKKTRAYFGG